MLHEINQQTKIVKSLIHSWIKSGGTGNSNKTNCLSYSPERGTKLLRKTNSYSNFVRRPLSVFLGPSVARLSYVTSESRSQSYVEKKEKSTIRELLTFHLGINYL